MVNFSQEKKNYAKILNFQLLDDTLLSNIQNHKIPIWKCDVTTMIKQNPIDPKSKFNI